MAKRYNGKVRKKPTRRFRDQALQGTLDPPTKLEELLGRVNEMAEIAFGIRDQQSDGAGSTKPAETAEKKTP